MQEQPPIFDSIEQADLYEVEYWSVCDLRKLAQTAHNAGVVTSDEHAEFQNAGYRGLYGGLPEELPTPEKSIRQLEQEEQSRLKHKGQLNLLSLHQKKPGEKENSQKCSGPSCGGQVK